MSPPLVSIITPCYNEADYLGETLESVRDQQYEHVEHIVRDGGSTDGTTDILESFEDEYNLRWTSEEDDGLYDAIHRGFEEAEGDILAWINGNDIYLPWSAGIAADRLTGDSVNWITGRSAIINESGQMKSMSRIQRFYRRAWIRRGWYHGRGLGWFCQPSMFWTADLYDRVAGLDGSMELAGEHDLWKQFAEQTNLVSVNTVLGVHRNHTGQLSEQVDEWYEEANPGRVPWLLGKLYANEVYSLYRIAMKRIDR